MKTTYGYLVWFLVTLFVVYSFCLNTAAAVFAEPIKNALHATDVQVSIAVGAFIVGFACMQIPGGFLLDKYNTKYVVSSGVLLLAAGNIIISFSTNLLFFSLANLIQGIGASFAFTAAGIVISQWFSPALFPIMLGLTQTLSCISAAFIHYFLILGLQSHDWSKIYLLLSLCGAILFFLTLVFVKSPEKSLPATTLSFKKSLIWVLKNKQLGLCTLAATTSFGPLLAYGGFWYMNVQKFYQVSILDSVVISGMLFVGLGLGTPVLGWLSNRLKSRKIVIHTFLCLGAMNMLLCLYLPHYEAESTIIIKIVSFLLGFFLSGAMLFYTMVSELSSNATRGLALSITNSGVFLFNSILMFLPYAFITTRSPMFFTYLWVLPFCLLISILFSYFIHETYAENKGRTQQ